MLSACPVRVFQPGVEPPACHQPGGGRSGADGGCTGKRSCGLRRRGRQAGRYHRNGMRDLPAVVRGGCRTCCNRQCRAGHRPGVSRSPRGQLRSQRTRTRNRFTAKGEDGVERQARPDGHAAFRLSCTAARGHGARICQRACCGKYREGRSGRTQPDVVGCNDTATQPTERHRGAGAQGPDRFRPRNSDNPGQRQARARRIDRHIEKQSRARDRDRGAYRQCRQPPLQPGPGLETG